METKNMIDCNDCLPRLYGLFCSLKELELKTLNQYKSTQTYKKGDYIFRQGETPQGFYCTFSGVVKVIKTTESGKEQILLLSQGSEMLGYRSFFSGEKYQASAQAVSETTLCFVKKEGIEKVFKEYPNLGFEFLKMVCVELRQAEEKFTDLADKTVEQRLAHFLKMIFRNINCEQQLLLSREEIASLIGARPETVIRVFSDWKKKGFIKTKAKSITVLKQQFLEQ
ncbi:MAG: Crp/Fnr family transcriptional regulator [Deltaproteobacteria bacterium]|nr:Crp/Fnr family transcriptional regulator [Deltaproteobacteria bacterium]